MPRPALFVFAKAPVAGAVKTRLQPTYTAAEAAEIAAILIRETLALAVANWDGPIYLATTPTTSHPLFTELASRHAVSVRAQAGADLGARMHEAIAHGVEHHDAAAVIGCDVPHCPGTTLGRANRWLRAGHNVFGPATDGGYYFVGLTHAYPEVFVDINWGGADVWTATQKRLAALKLRHELLPPLRDVDTPDDLRAAARAVPALRRFVK